MQLWLDKGRWNGQRLVEASYVTAASALSALNSGYGYLWWLNIAGRIPEAPRSMVYASGAFGQYAFVLPEQNMVIATMGFGAEDMNPLAAIWHALGPILPR
jgi:CubicO group peptidase (beta-lactamase class C family)